jgi:hypothetical protein
MSFPDHFDSAAHFAQYILECAERDRLVFLSAMTPHGCPLSKEDQIAVGETKAELREIRKRMRIHRRSAAWVRRLWARRQPIRSNKGKGEGP